MAEITAHEAADLFPMLGEEELGKLAADIEINGLRNPIVLYRGEILDGRNRLKACELVDVEPRFEEYEGADPVAFVISTNLHRRHLSPAQLVAISLEALPMFEAEALERYQEGVGRPSKSGEIFPQIKEAEREPRARDKAAETFGVNPRYVSDGKRIKAEAPELIELMKADAINVPQAKELAKLDEDRRAAAVERIQSGDEARQVVKQAATAAFSSVSDQWFTPTDILERARKVLGAFDLDPASSEIANREVKAARYFTKDDDGLVQAWSGRVWLNPPYGRNESGISNQDLWSATLIERWISGEIEAGMLLVTFSPDRSWFRRLWSHPLCCFHKRMKFRTPGGDVPTSPVDANVLVGVGVDLEAFIEAFGEIGTIIAPRSQCLEVWNA